MSALHLWFVNPSGRADGTGVGIGSHSPDASHRPHKDNIPEAVKPTVVIGGDVQTLSHGAG